jgi:hypothetical protein
VAPRHRICLASFKKTSFRPRNYNKKKTEKKFDSDDSDSDVDYLVRHRVKKGIVVTDRPLSLESLTSLNQRLAAKEDLFHKKMILEAEMVCMNLLTYIHICTMV